MNNALSKPEKFGDFLDDFVKKAQENGVQAAASLILVSERFWDKEIATGRLEAKSFEGTKLMEEQMEKALSVLREPFESSPGDMLVFRPAESFHKDAVRAGLPQAEALEILAKPLVRGDHHLAASEWTHLGAATWMDRGFHTGDLLKTLAVKNREAFESLRDPQALKNDLAEMVDGAPLRGVNDPVNQWLPAFKDTNGKTHDILDLAVVAAGTQQFSMPALLMAKRSKVPDLTAGALALHAVRAHDILATSNNDQLASRNADFPSHISHVVAVSLMLGASAHLTQDNWENGKGVAKARGIELGWDSPRPSRKHDISPQSLVMAVVRNFIFIGDENLAQTIRKMHADGHDVTATAQGVSQQEPPIFTAVKRKLVETAKALFDCGVDVNLRHKGRSLSEVVCGPHDKRTDADVIAMKQILAAAEARALVGAKSNELKVPTGPSGPKPSWA